MGVFWDWSSLSWSVVCVNGAFCFVLPCRDLNRLALFPRNLGTVWAFDSKAVLG